MPASLILLITLTKIQRWSWKKILWYERRKGGTWPCWPSPLELQVSRLCRCRERVCKPIKCCDPSEFNIFLCCCLCWQSATVFKPSHCATVLWHWLVVRIVWRLNFWSILQCLQLNRRIVAPEGWPGTKLPWLLDFFCSGYFWLFSQEV